MSANCRITIKTPKGESVCDINPEQLKAIFDALRLSENKTVFPVCVAWFANKIRDLL